MKVDVKVTGTKELSALLNQLGASAPRAMGQCLRREGERLLKISVPMTPLRYGPLRASGRVDGPNFSGHNVWVTVGYGGPAVDYALFVHEMPDTYNFTTPGTGPKYLENAAKEWLPGFNSGIRRCLKVALKARGRR